jgi:hypothetical protein
MLVFSLNSKFFWWYFIEKIPGRNDFINFVILQVFFGKLSKYIPVSFCNNTTTFLNLLLLRVISFFFKFVSFLTIICGENLVYFCFFPNKFVTVNCQRIISSYSNMCSCHLIYGYLGILSFFLKAVSFLIINCGENSHKLYIYYFCKFVNFRQ